MSAPAAAPPARLSAAGEAALKAEFGKAYDGVRLRASLQAGLVAYFAGKGLGLTDVKDMLLVSKNFPERSERIWERLLKSDMGIAEESEVECFLLWMHSRQLGSSTAVGHANDQVRRALDVLDSHGYSISANMRQDMEAALALGEAGSEKEQCCNALTVHILYLGRAPDSVEEVWWNEQFQRLGGRVGGKVEITKSPTYQKAHAKSPESVMTLERALKKEERFNEWSIQTVDALNTCGLPKAAAMLMRVLAQATRLANGNWSRKKIYLYGYFFEEFTGVGLPADYATRSAFNAMASVPAPSMDRMLGEGGPPSAAGSALSLSEYSRLGGSVSQASESNVSMKDLAEVIKLSIKEGLASRGEGGGGAGSEASGASSGGKKGTCMYCHRKNCLMLQGGAPCREAKQAAEMLRASQKESSGQKKTEDKGESE